MRHPNLNAARLAALAGAALLAAGCGGGDDAGNAADANAADANLMLEAPMNDASALESVLNETQPDPVVENGNQGTDDPDVLGNTSGGDTGGNTVESNVAGM